MSNPDNFIEEVSEELRRDRLYSAFRRYGWIGGVAVLLVVGGAAYREYALVRDAGLAQAFGDGIIDALDIGDGAARASTLADLPTNGGQAALKALVQTSDLAADKAASLAILGQLAADESQPQIYRDLAVLRQVLLAGQDMPLDQRRAALQGIAQRGLGLLAREQLAYLLLEEGNKVEALAALTALIQDQAAPQGLKARAGQMIVALGGALPAANAGG
jgi:hypothetical protein